MNPKLLIKLKPSAKKKKTSPEVDEWMLLIILGIIILGMSISLVEWK